MINLDFILFAGLLLSGGCNLYQWARMRITSIKFVNKYLNDNIDSLIIQAHDKYTSSDKAKLICKWIEEININDLEEWEKYGLKNKILDKLQDE